MTCTRKSIGAAAFLLIGGLVPVQAASPVLSARAAAPGTARQVCGAATLGANSYGSCVAGSGCCFGYPEAPCGPALY